jgi:AraC-like DNA-binding protein
LRVGNAWHIDNLGTYGMLILRSRSLAEALETACGMFPKMNSGASLSVEPAADAVWFKHRLIGEDRPGSAQGHLFTLTLLVDLVRIAAGRTWMPSRVRLPPTALVAVPADSAYRPLLEEASVNEAAIAVDPALLDLPIHVSSNGHGNGFAGRLERFEATAPSREFLRSLEQCLVPLMKSGTVSLDHVAAVSTLSTRTLQRRLDEEGLSFSEVLDRTRAAEARRLLARRNLKVIEIAYELGYAEPASFTRAFTRWTGVSPSEFRDRHQA